MGRRRGSGTDSALGYAETLDADGVARRAFASLERKLFGMGAPVRCGRYLLGDLLGRGGMGSVYRARDEELGREVAVKVVPLARHADADRSPVREARAAARVVHPNVIEIYDVGVTDDGIYIAMELVSGPHLRGWLADARSPEEILRVLRAAGAGLAAAHAAGVVHRDFKPENVLVADDRPRVVDFGLARADPSGDLQSTGAADLAATESTRAGTPAYLSPEQIAGDAVGPAADQFSFCVTLYEALYGVRPFGGNTRTTVFRKVLSGAVDPAPAHARVPAALRRILLRGLATEPSDRYPSMQALLDALAATDRPRRRPLVVGVGLGAVGLAVWLGSGSGQTCDEAGTSVDEAWSHARRTALVDSMRASNLPFAEHTAKQASAALDDYARQLRGRLFETCAIADTDPGVADRRFMCLSKRTDALSVTVDQLAGGGADVVGAAVAMVEALPAVDGCDDAARLEASVDFPPEAERSAVASVRRSLARARSLVESGQTDDALRVVDQACGRVRDYAPLEAECALGRGGALQGSGDYEAAEAALEEAFFGARAIAHEDAAAEASLELMYLVGVQRNRVGDGFAWARHAEAQTRLRGSPDQLAAYHGRLGSLQHGRLDLDAALSSFGRALEIIEEHRGPEALDAAKIRTNIGAVLDTKGEYERALAEFERVLEIRRSRLGPGHPKVANAASNVASMLLVLGKPDAALELSEEVLRIETALHPNGHPAVERASMNHAATLFRVGERERAVQLFEETLASREARLGPDDPSLVSLMSNLGMGLAEVDRPEEGLRILERALAIVDAHPDVANRNWLPTVLSNSGVVLSRLRRHDEAILRFERAIEEIAADAGEGDLSGFGAHIGLSKIHRERGAPEEARPWADKALAMAERHPDALLKRAEARWEKAQVLWATGEHAEARAVMGEARRFYVDLGTGGEHDLALVDAWLTEHTLGSGRGRDQR